MTFETFRPVPLEGVLPDAPADAVHLVDRLLVLSPGGRLSTEDALDHAWFRGHAVLLPTADKGWFGVGGKRREVEVATTDQVEGVTMRSLMGSLLDGAREAIKALDR